MYEIDIYKTEGGKEPFIEWKDSLEIYTQARIDARLRKIECSGHLGDSHLVQSGVHELRFDFGPGYRVYYGMRKKKIIILISGGSKRGPSRDIGKAVEYWKEYLSSQK